MFRSLLQWMYWGVLDNSDHPSFNIIVTLATIIYLMVKGFYSPPPLKPPLSCSSIYRTTYYMTRSRDIWHLEDTQVLYKREPEIMGMKVFEVNSVSSFWDLSLQFPYFKVWLKMKYLKAPKINWALQARVALMLGWTMLKYLCAKKNVGWILKSFKVKT